MFRRIFTAAAMCFIGVLSGCSSDGGISVTPQIVVTGDELGEPADPSELLTPLDCEGLRVWESDQFAFFLLPSGPNAEESFVYYSEGGAQLPGLVESATPCLVVWAYAPSDNCVLPFSTEIYFDQLATTYPEDFRAVVNGVGQLEVSFSSLPFDPDSFRTEFYEPAGLSLSQLMDTPRCS